MTRLCLEPIQKVFHDSNGIGRTETVRCQSEIVYNPTLKACQTCLTAKKDSDRQFDALLPHYHKGNGMIALGEWKENTVDKKVSGQWCMSGHPNLKKWE